MQYFPLLGYAVCSSSLLVLNKLVLRIAPLPSLLSSLQFVVAASSAAALHLTGSTHVVLSWRLARAHGAYVVVFALAIYTNMRALQLHSVNTLIVTRACCPLLVACLEALTLHRALPSRHTTALLSALLAGAVGYAAAEAPEPSDAPTAGGGEALISGWLCGYYIVICLSDMYGKSLASTEAAGSSASRCPDGQHGQCGPCSQNDGEMVRWPNGPMGETMARPGAIGAYVAAVWAPVLYTNALSAPLMLATAAITGKRALSPHTPTSQARTGDLPQAFDG